MSSVSYCLFEKKTQNIEIHPATGDRINYQPWGVIIDAMPDSETLSVVYRTTPGTLVREQLARKEIEIIPTSQAEWRQLYELILWQENDQGVDRAPDGTLVH